MRTLFTALLALGLPLCAHAQTPPKPVVHQRPPQPQLYSPAPAKPAPKPAPARADTAWAARHYFKGTKRLAARESEWKDGRRVVQVFDRQGHLVQQFEDVNMSYSVVTSLAFYEDGGVKTATVGTNPGASMHWYTSTYTFDELTRLVLEEHVTMPHMTDRRTVTWLYKPDGTRVKQEVQACQPVQVSPVPPPTQNPPPPVPKPAPPTPKPTPAPKPVPPVSVKTDTVWAVEYRYYSGSRTVAARESAWQNNRRVVQVLNRQGRVTHTFEDVRLSYRTITTLTFNDDGGVQQAQVKSSPDAGLYGYISQYYFDSQARLVKEVHTKDPIQSLTDQRTIIWHYRPDGTRYKEEMTPGPAVVPSR